MSGLFGSLQSTVKALNAQSRALEVAGKNLANVNNADYARQRVIFGDRGTVVTPQGTQSLGLEAMAVEQVRDALLDKQVIREIGLTSSFETQQQAYERAQASLGQSIDSSAATDAASGTSGLGGTLDDFFNAFSSLASRPTDSGERQNLLQQAGILTDQLNLTDSRLAQVQADLNTQVSTDVDSANSILSSLANLNAQIHRAEINNPGSAVDLRDQRQSRLEQLAAILPVETRDIGGGQLQVFTRDGSGNELGLVDGYSVTSPLTFDGTTVTAGSPATAIAPSSGSIIGALTARDGPVQQLRDELDAIARQLVTSVNAAYNPDGAGNNFFDPAGVTAGTIRVSSAVTAANLRTGAGTAAGDNSIALAISALASQSFSTAGGDAIDGTFSQHYARAVTSIGQSLATATARAEDQTAIENLVRGQRSSVSGVSLDEEMADLVRFQRAFQASSRVFSVIDDLLETLVNRL